MLMEKITAFSSFDGESLPPGVPQGHCAQPAEEALGDQDGLR